MHVVGRYIGVLSVCLRAGGTEARTKGGAVGEMIESYLPGREPLFRGKVRDVYDLGTHLLLVATDRISAFDVVLPTPIPGKGRNLTRLSNFWFDKTADILPNHLTGLGLDHVIEEESIRTELTDRSVVVLQAEPLKIEAIVRGYLAGSGWLDYQETGAVSGVRLPPRLQESDRLPNPIFTPSTKAPRGQHDQNIDFDQAAEIVGSDLAEAVREASLAIYQRATTIAERRGLIVADTKLEFGLCNGELILIDELLTPDSSRFWDRDTYRARRPQPSFDKQFVREHLTAVGWNRRPPAPELPQEIVKQTAVKYHEAFERLTESSVDS